MHDFALFKMDPDFPAGPDFRRRTWVDSASGMDAQYPDRDSRVALKRGLTRRALSRIRIRVEHTIPG